LPSSSRYWRLKRSAASQWKHNVNNVLSRSFKHKSAGVDKWKIAAGQRRRRRRRRRWRQERRRRRRSQRGRPESGRS
jgi:hypothetical protein